MATLRLLADRAESAGRKAGVEMGEHRRYKPHLTVARSREAFDVRPYVETLDGFTSRTWTVTGLALVRSNLPGPGCRASSPVTRRSPAARSAPPVRLGGVDPKTRNGSWPVCSC